VTTTSRRSFSRCAAAALWLLSLFGPAVGSVRAAVQFNPLVTGLNNPLAFVDAGDGTSRRFIVQREGLILVWDGRSVFPAPFLDLSGLLPCSGDCGERGLLALAFHPNFRVNGLLYVLFTNSGGNLELRRYTASPPTADAADPVSALTLLTIPHAAAANHNGGWLSFGRDGYLYWSTGDGGGGGDPFENGQNKESLLGKMLRLDVDGDDFPADPTRNYRIPVTNPFAGATPGADEIWAYGLRNPFRYSFDRATGDLFIGDVGQGLWEEISFAPASSFGGENYGWDCREGAHPYADPNGDLNAQCDPPDSMVEPILEYGHSAGRCSVIGGYRYRGTLVPDLAGKYLFGDYCTAEVFAGSFTGAAWTSSLVADLSFNFGLFAFAEDRNGELYVLDAATDRVLCVSSVPGCPLSHDDFEYGDLRRWTHHTP